MKKEIYTRVQEETTYILATKKTIRQVATDFQISKSTVHKDLKERLKQINIQKYQEVEKLLTYHKEIRHLRGGESTKRKFLKKELEI